MNEKIMIIGGGRSGIAAASFLKKKHIDCCVYDIKTFEELKAQGFGIENIANQPGIEFILGREIEKSDLYQTTKMVVSPGVPLEAPPVIMAKELNIPIESEVEFAFSFCKGKIIGVTGTNGKTTVTSLLGSIFKEFQAETYVGGNIGDAFINYAEKGSSSSTYILELSSFQLALAQHFKPDVAVFTNITPDHLDRHKTMENYILAKTNIFRNQTSEDYLILNYDDLTVRSFKDKSLSKTLYYTATDNDKCNAYLKDESIYIKIADEAKILLSRADLKLYGLHNVANIMAATLAAIVSGVDILTVQNAIKDFSPVENRIEYVDTVKGVDFINDSKGTNPEATMIAIEAMTKPIILFLGGKDKQSDFDALFQLISQKVKHTIILGETASKIISSAEAAGYKNYTKVENYHEGMKKAVELAVPGDVVLLSPACASWDMFESYEQRGKLFKKLVKDLKK